MPAARQALNRKKRAGPPGVPAGRGGVAGHIKVSSTKNLEEATPEIPLGKALASTEKKTRDGAIRSLAAFLAKKGTEPLPPVEMAKLWKGIFYCFWMSDKPVIQQALAQELSDLVLLIPSPSGEEGASDEGSIPALRCSPRARSGLAFVEGFWDTMIREWNGIDRLRLDKFYMLLRRFLNAAFRLLASEDWEENALFQFSFILEKPGGPLCSPNDLKVPDSIVYHLSDIYMEELEKAVGWYEQQKAASTSIRGTVPVVELLEPFIRALATCHSGPIYERLLSGVIRPFLDDCLLAQRKETGQKEKPKKGRKGKQTEEVEEEELSYPKVLAFSKTPQVSGEDDEDDDDTERDASAASTPRALRAAVYRKLFEAASKPDSAEPRRRKLYALWTEEQDRLNEE
ncbi:Nop52-domain-containing protein [Violaceomyces palustris]|uniref:Nop52-domain-containing protein n=1 Tax=Violaceomyces palustris TaxID=1673888 RepID=A0ACD0P2R0_9BASI|nr:Nop52-domain-containing protein [Violaceomyces palustris]